MLQQMKSPPFEEVDRVSAFSVIEIMIDKGRIGCSCEEVNINQHQGTKDGLTAKVQM
jgi:hypothetical protein